MPEVVMPRLSDTMEEGELSKWLKQVGDEIHKGDVLAEIETDKATMDLESFEEGILEQLLVEAGTVVPIGAPLAVIGDGSAAKSAPAEPEAPASKEAAAPVEERRADEQPAEQKPAAEQPSTTSVAEPVEAAPAEESPSTGSGSEAAAPGPLPDKLRMSPLARKTARDHGIDPASLTGSGPGGRIVRADVDAAIAGQDAPRAKTATPASTAPAAAAAPAALVDEEVPLNRIRKVTAKRLTESQAVPHFFLTSIVDAERLLAFRAEANSALAASGVKASINDLIVRACAVALRLHPDANASFGGDKLLRHGHVNIGVAVATDNGLMVPVVRDADRKSIGEIATETAGLAAKARDGKLGLDEMSGGTFTISNLGMFGIDQFTAVINPPEAAILAVGAASPVPVLRDGALVEVPKMKITLTVDHRVLDGATAAAFLRDLTAVLEEPLRIVL